MTIPASAIVSVNPSVLSAGGKALDLGALVLTTNTRTPLDQVKSFSSANDVSSYYGASSVEAAGAAIYFGGFDNSDVKPGQISFSLYPAAAISAWLRGGSLASMTLVQLKALSGQITLTVNGTATTSAAINLTAATSFSNAATIIQAAFASPGFTVTFDSVSSAFLFTVNTTGASSTISFGSGTLSTPLLLTSAGGATTSQGAAATDPVTHMNALVNRFMNFATLMTAFNPDTSGNANRLLFAQWTSQQNNRYAYIVADSDASAHQSAPAASSLGYLVQQAGYSGTVVVFDTSSTFNYSWFICGSVAAIDFNQTKGRATLAFKNQSGLVPADLDQTQAKNLTANGYNYYTEYATANDSFTFLYPGSISGKFKWADSYVNQIWMSNQLQLALMTLLTNVKSIPYNTAGYTLIHAGCADPINAAVNFGAIQEGVPLSAQQAAAVNNTAGVNISTTLQNRGWYLQILPATAQVRAARGTPPMKFWYMDGGSVQSISLASILVQ